MSYEEEDTVPRADPLIGERLPLDSSALAHAVCPCQRHASRFPREWSSLYMRLVPVAASNDWMPHDSHKSQGTQSLPHPQQSLPHPQLSFACHPWRYKGDIKAWEMRISAAGACVVVAHELAPTPVVLRRATWTISASAINRSLLMFITDARVRE